jgi:hypothetical protein
MLKHALVLLLVISAAAVCIWVSALFVRSWLAQPDAVLACEDRGGKYSSDRVADRAQYFTCREADAKLFLDKDYTETKDLTKAFLTLLTALLVASITFSEKIVDLSRSGWWSRGMMICCWVLLLIAIATCGAALAFMTTAVGWATYYPQADYRQFEMKAVWLLIIAGLSFGSALVSLLIAGIISLIDSLPAFIDTV